MRKIVFGITILLLCSLKGFSQNNLGTPYSRYGFGLLPDNHGSYVGMGGVSAAMRDAYNINYLNPASYTALDSMRFYFQTGYSGEYVDISTYNKRGDYTVAQNASLVMAFRVYKKLYASFGFNEKSDIGYDLYNLRSSTGEVLMYYHEFLEGEGGLNEAYLGLAYRFGKLSVGVNAAYIFGKIEERLTISPEIQWGLNYFNYQLKSRTQNHINDFIFTLGAQYPIELNKKSTILLGGSMNFGTYLSGKKAYEAYRINYSSGSTEILNDELQKHGKVFYPSRFTLGATYMKGNRWMLSGDYTFQRMSAYKEFGEKDEFNNYHKIAIGGSFQPNVNSRNWLDRNKYTAGVYFSRSHIELKEKHINSFGATIGTQVLFRSLQQGQELLLGVAIDAGFRGTKANGLILEQYVKLRLNIAFKEVWFMKHKIH